MQDGTVEAALHIIAGQLNEDQIKAGASGD